MNQFQAGFARVNVTPQMGIGIEGYFKIRLADGVLDELEINALALADGENRLLLMCVDNCGIVLELMDRYRRSIAQATGVPFEAIYVSCTHTHTGPSLHAELEDEDQRRYDRFMESRLVDAARFALADLKPARLGWAVGQAPGISFARRFRMKDGSIQTNPGVNNPNIDAPIGEVDERVNLLRFDREGGSSVALVNFGDHPDTVGGCKISADWPGFLRRRLEKALDGVNCIFFNGAQGDVNHVNVHPTPGDLNDMFMDFDDVSRGYGHARHMGNVVAGAVLQVYDKVNYLEDAPLRFMQRAIRVPANLPRPEDMAQARRYEDLHQAGRDNEIPFKGMMLTTVVAEAERMLRLEHGPEAFEMCLSGVAIGNIALIGIPGEPFTEIGRALKRTEGWDLVLPCCITNGYEGYFPTKEAYDEGGYEARSSNFKAGVAELIIAEGRRLLSDLRK